MYKIIGADGKEYGPISAEQLGRWISEARANAQSRVLAEGATEWKTLAELPEFATALARPPAPTMIPAQISAPLTTRNNPMAVTGLILGVFSVTLGLCCCYGFPFNVLGIVFSLIGMSQIKKDPQREQGKGLAIAGLVLSVLGVLLGLIFLAVGLAFGLPDIMREMKKL
jgi:hypothetical protein